MRFSKQTVEALEQLANNSAANLNGVFDPDNLNQDAFPASDAFMQPCAIIAAITANMPDKASMLFTIGAKTNKRYALMLLDNDSTFLEIDDTMLAEIKLDCAHTTRYPATGYGTRKTGRKLTKGRRLQPIGPKDIKEWLAKSSTTRTVELLKTLKRTKGFDNWLRAAALAQPKNTQLSQVQIDATPIDPKNIPKEVWDQFRDDVEEKRQACPEFTAAIEPIFQAFFAEETQAPPHLLPLRTTILVTRLRLQTQALRQIRRTQMTSITCSPVLQIGWKHPNQFQENELDSILTPTFRNTGVLVPI